MNISIIGGGISGLTAALALHKMGISASVYEQSATLNEIGAGVWLQPNAMKVLKWLGLEEEIKGKGRILNKMEIAYADLKAIKEIKDNIVADQGGNQTVAIHRGKLQKILYDRFRVSGDVYLNMKYRSHQEIGGQYHIDFGNKIVKTDVLIGADGIRSRLRESLGMPSIYRHSKQICSRGIAKIVLPSDLIREGKELWSKKLRFGFSQLSGDTVYFFTVANEEIAPKVFNIESLCKLFSGFHPIVSEIIKASGSLHVTELIDLKRLPTWHRGNSCLIGDAAHATTPNMGQGACQGIEDAFYISQYMKKYEGNVETAFGEFEESRRKKVDYVVNNSWNFGRMAHNPMGQSFLRGIMKLTPESVLNKQMNRLYHVEGL